MSHGTASELLRQYFWCRYEAHLWIKDLHRQVYLGGYEHEEHAAEAYDVAALKSKGINVKTNFDIARHVPQLIYF